MATISITIPDADAQRVMDAFAATFGYDPAVDGTKGAFAKKQVARYARDITFSYEAAKAEETARANVVQPTPVSTS